MYIHCRVLLLKSSILIIKYKYLFIFAVLITTLCITKFFYYD